MANISYSQRGVSIIAAIFIIVILAFMGVMFVSFVNTSSFTAVNDLQSDQALYVAQGGLEYILNAGTFPNFSMGGVSKSLGAGQFVASTPAYLTAAVNLGNTTINVNSTAGFYAGSVAVPGWIIIDADTISYTGSTGNSFTGVANISAPHASGNAVYPVASQTANLANNCTSPVTIQTSYASNNFLIPGIVTIGTEMFYCTGATIAAPGSFNNCTRCYQGSISATHNAATGNIFQYVVTSTGTVGNAQRTIKAGISNTANAAVRYDARTQPLNGFNITTFPFTFTWNHTVTAARANTMLIVGVSLYTAATQSVQGVTYNAIPLTLLSAISGTNVRVEQWGLVGPPGGAAYPVVVTLTGPALAVGGSISFYNVNQANPSDVNPVRAFANNNTPSLTITTATANDMVVDTLAAMGTATFNNNVCLGQTSRWSIIVNNGTNYLRGSGSYKAAGAGAPPVSVTTCWNLSGNPYWAYSAVALQPQGIAVVDWRELVN